MPRRIDKSLRLIRMRNEPYPYLQVGVALSGNEFIEAKKTILILEQARIYKNNLPN